MAKEEDKTLFEVEPLFKPRICPYQRAELNEPSDSWEDKVISWNRSLSECSGNIECEETVDSVCGDGALDTLYDEAQKACPHDAPGDEADVTAIPPPPPRGAKRADSPASPTERREAVRKRK
jgi:hypothetical protein